MLRRIACAIVVLCGATVVLPVAPAGASPSTVTIGAAASSAIEPGFVGITIEALWAADPAFDPAASPIAGLLSPLGSSIIRFGGTTSDRDVAWQRRPSDPVPRWAKATVTPDAFRALRRLADATGSSIDLAVNLYRDDPGAAADEVASATRILGPALRIVRMGNEPDLYTYTYPRPMSYQQWVERWGRYRAAILARSPGTRFGGPDLYLPAWLDDLAGPGSPAGSLSELDHHLYAFSDCGGTGVGMGQLLSDSVLEREDALIARLGALARPRGLPISLDEMNSISCGSKSPTQWESGTALWGLRALMTAARRGVGSVGVQVNPWNCRTYTPWCFTDRSDLSRFERHPLDVAMGVVAGLEGGRFRKLAISPPGLPPGCSAWALAMGDGSLRVVLANAGATEATLQLRSREAWSLSAVTTMQVDDAKGTALPLVATRAASGGLGTVTVPGRSAMVLAASASS